MTDLLDAIARDLGGARVGDALTLSLGGVQVTASRGFGADGAPALELRAATAPPPGGGASRAEASAAMDELERLGFRLRARTDSVRAIARADRLTPEAARAAVSHLVTASRGPSRRPANQAFGALIPLGALAIIIFTGIVNGIARPLLSSLLHPLAIAVGLALTAALAAPAYMRHRRGDRTVVVIIASIASLIVCTLTDGVAVLVNQVAGPGEATSHVVILRYAEHKRIRTSKHGTAFDATTNVVVDKDGTQIALGQFEHLKGTFPIGTKLRLTLHRGALGFTWVVKLAPLAPPSPR